jgi:sulfate/thiosulfate transport system permease protein
MLQRWINQIDFKKIPKLIAIRFFKQPKILLGIVLGSYVFFLLILPISALFILVFQNNLSDVIQKATDPIAISAYIITLKLACLAALINTFFGFIITWVLTRYNFFGKKYLDAAVDLPFALPTSVAGLTLTTIYSDQGWIGNLLQITTIKIVFTQLGVLLAMVFVSFPFVIRTLQPALQELETSLEEAAWSLGASPWQTFSKVIFPTLWPAILTGFTLSFSRALGEFGSIVMISSNLPLKDLVASVLIYQSLEQYDYLGASVIGIVVLAIALISLLTINTLQSFLRKY